MVLDNCSQYVNGIFRYFYCCYKGKKIIIFMSPHDFKYIFKHISLYDTDMDSWYRHGLMVLAKTHGIDMDLWYSIGTPESHTYERAECCPYAGF